MADVVSSSRSALAFLLCPPAPACLNLPVSTYYIPKALGSQADPSLPSTGQLLRGAVDDQGKNTKAALMVGIKLDLEAEIHLTARVRGDIAIGLY